jgi:hypothetical protein
MNLQLKVEYCQIPHRTSVIMDIVSNVYQNNVENRIIS